MWSKWNVIGLLKVSEGRSWTKCFRKFWKSDFNLAENTFFLQRFQVSNSYPPSDIKYTHMSNSHLCTSVALHVECLLTTCVPLFNSNQHFPPPSYDFCGQNAHMSHSLPLSPCPEIYSLCLFLHCCPVSKFFSTIFLDSVYMCYNMVFMFLFLTHFPLYNRGSCFLNQGFRLGYVHL